jgi:hypothetical protein
MFQRSYGTAVSALSLWSDGEGAEGSSGKAGEPATSGLSRIHYSSPPHRLGLSAGLSLVST